MEFVASKALRSLSSVPCFEGVMYCSYSWLIFPVRQLCCMRAQRLALWQNDMRGKSSMSPILLLSGLGTCGTNTHLLYSLYLFRITCCYTSQMGKPTSHGQGQKDASTPLDGGKGDSPWGHAERITWLGIASTATSGPEWFECVSLRSTTSLLSGLLWQVPEHCPDKPCVLC